MIGRAQHAVLRTHNQFVRHHFLLRKLEGRWQVAALSSAGGVFMNRMPMKTARWLDSGDVFYVSDDEPFRFTEEELDPRWEAHALRLAQSDDSDAAWLVFSDAIQELGDETGKKMLSAGEDPVLPLGFLDRLRSDGAVTFACRFGFIRSLALRQVGVALELRLDGKPMVIEGVLRHPLARQLRVLELDVPSFDEMPLELLAACIVDAAPPSLKVVRLLGVIGAPPRQLFPSSLQVEWAPI